MLFESYFKSYINEFCSIEVERWNYPYGCILMGMKGLYEVTGDADYLRGIYMFAKRYVNDDGVIKGYDVAEHNVDLMASGNILYYLYKETKEERFKKGIDLIMENMKEQPRTSFGNFWHKTIYPYQVWLDGLYMAQPFYLKYETLFNAKKNYGDIVSQFNHVRKYLYDEEKHLYYHAYDEKREMIWANKETGCSPCFWLRAMGWYVMALVDCYEIMSEEAYDQREVFADLLREAIDGLLPYRDKEYGLFYQLIDRSDLEGNYLETSGSAMIAYAILKGCRQGVLNQEQYQRTGKEILLAIEAEQVEYINGRLHLNGTCASAGLGPKTERNGSPEYYLSEAVKPDNSHGIAACMMAYGEWLKLTKE